MTAGRVDDSVPAPTSSTIVERVTVARKNTEHLRSLSGVLVGLRCRSRLDAFTQIWQQSFYRKWAGGSFIYLHWSILERHGKWTPEVNWGMKPCIGPFRDSEAVGFGIGVFNELIDW